MVIETRRSILSVNRQDDLRELISFLENEVRPHAEEKSQECLLSISQAIKILENFGQENSDQENFENQEGVILRSRVEDELGYNAVQLKVSDKEVEIAHIIKFLSVNGQNKRRNRLFYLDSQGHCENHIGTWNGIGDVIADMKNFFSFNDWKLSVG